MSLVSRLASMFTHRPAAPRPSHPDTPEARELAERVARAVPFWLHSIDLPFGVTTPGLKTPEGHKHELASLKLPDLRGKSVLDIGCWDGFYSFAAERLGASRVVALDRYVWALDWEAKRRYRAECSERGIPTQPYDRVPHLMKYDELPGKRGFDLAHEVLQSRVEVVVADLMNADLEALGQFDVVLYLGGLYHKESPLLALRRLRQVTKGLAVIETAATEIGGHPQRHLCEFYPPSAPLEGDTTNFWAPNASALTGMCESAGFRGVDVLTKVPTPAKGQIRRYRLIAHAFV